MKRRRLSIILVFWMMACAIVEARPAQTQTLTAEQAKDHVGETATVCGEVASSHYAYNTRGHPTFLNLDRAYPHQIFTIVIWGNDRGKFDHPERRYRHKHICVTGTIKMYRHVPEIIARTPRQINVR